MSRPRSPIEMMVDKACGFNPENPPPSTKPSDEEIQKRFTAVVDAAMKWRRNHKKHAATRAKACDEWRAIGGW